LIHYYDMRLDPIERKALHNALKPVISPVFLFGSRVDDAARGGDIDILILSGDDPFALSRRVARDFFLHCEEKIDVVVMNPDSLTREEQAFLNSIRLERIQ